MRKSGGLGLTVTGVVGPQTLCVNVVVDVSWFVKSLGLCGHVHLLVSDFIVLFESVACWHCYI